MTRLVMWMVGAAAIVAVPAPLKVRPRPGPPSRRLLRDIGLDDGHLSPVDTALKEGR